MERIFIEASCDIATVKRQTTQHGDTKTKAKKKN